MVSTSNLYERFKSELFKFSPKYEHRMSNQLREYWVYTGTVDERYPNERLSLVGSFLRATRTLQ